MPGPESRNRTSGYGPLIRYILVQVPGILVLGAGLYMLLGWGWISRSTAAWVMVIWVAKDAALYPLYRPALQSGIRGQPVPTLEGARGRAHSDITDRGLVVINGEFWRARSAADPIPNGTPIRVQSTHGRILTVTPDPGDRQ